MATEPTMVAYLVEVRKQEESFDGHDFQFIPRKDNYIANALARQAYS